MEGCPAVAQAAMGLFMGQVQMLCEGGQLVIIQVAQVASGQRQGIHALIGWRGQPQPCESKMQKIQIKESVVHHQHHVLKKAQQTRHFQDDEKEQYFTDGELKSTIGKGDILSSFKLLNRQEMAGME